jgi:hypothetical protein
MKMIADGTSSAMASRLSLSRRYWCRGGDGGADSSDGATRSSLVSALN